MKSDSGERGMWRPANAQWWVLLTVALVVVIAWPPRDGRSLVVTFINWVVDPANQLPVLPAQLELGLGDDPDAVAAHDQQVQQYDAIYLKGGWTRRRLQLKVVRDPFDPATERQLLLAGAVVAVFAVWRFGGRGDSY
jgi:hypothetical protein